MAEFGDRRQREELRHHLGAQVDDEPQDVGRLPAEADARDVRIGRLHPRRELLQFRRELDASRSSTIRCGSLSTMS